MHKNILDANQQKLLPFIGQFCDDYYLVGGTAIALQIGHRKSIDFDLFTYENIKKDRIFAKIAKNKLSMKTIFEDGEQLHGIIQDVRVTFYQYPYQIVPEISFENGIRLPSLLSLGAMKAFALGRRAKWKDYVDMYFLLRDHYSLEELEAKAQELFGSIFSTKLFRQQLTYFSDVNYSEVVDYVGEPIDNATIEKFLITQGTEEF